MFAERNLTRLALLFIRAKTNISSCAALKEALFWKFKQTASLAQMHQIFANCRCQPNEQLFEYILKMKEIVQRGNVDHISLIHYTINGIKDTLQNEFVLYGCSDLLEFKNKLLIYEEICDSVPNFKTIPGLFHGILKNATPVKNQRKLFAIDMGYQVMKIPVYTHRTKSQLL